MRILFLNPRSIFITPFIFLYFQATLSDLEDVDFYCKLIKAPSVCTCLSKEGDPNQRKQYPEMSTFHFRHERASIFLSHPTRFGLYEDLNKLRTLPTHESIIRGNGRTLWIPCINDINDLAGLDEEFNINSYSETPRGMNDFPGFIVKSLSGSLAMGSLKELMDSHVRLKKPLMKLHQYHINYTEEDEDQLEPEVDVGKRRPPPPPDSLEDHPSKKTAATNSLLTMKSFTADELETGSEVDSNNRKIYTFGERAMIEEFEKLMIEYKEFHTNLARTKKAAAEAQKAMKLEELAELDKEILKLEQISEELETVQIVHIDKKPNKDDADPPKRSD